MRHIVYLLYGVLVIVVCTWINASEMDDYNRASSRSGGRSWWSGGGGHK